MSSGLPEKLPTTPEPEYKLRPKHNQSAFYDEIVIPKARRARVIPTGEMLDFLDSKGPMFKQMWIKRFKKGLTLESLTFITKLMKEARLDGATKETDGDGSDQPGTPEGDLDAGRTGSATPGPGVQVQRGDGESRSSEELGSAQGESSTAPGDSSSAL